MKSKISVFLQGLITYDYILFGSVFFLFLFFIILAILLRRKRGLAIFMMTLSFIAIFIGPFVGYVKMHEYLFKHTTTLLSQKRLLFTPAIVVQGSLKNESNLDFQSCLITAHVHKTSKNQLKNYIYSFKTLTKKSMLKEGVLKGEEVEFKLIIEPFTYTKDYNISIEASCK